MGMKIAIYLGMRHALKCVLCAHSVGHQKDTEWKTAGTGMG